MDIRPTDEELAAEFVSGNAESAVALAERYAPVISGLAAKYGNYVAFDRDDARQTALESLLIAARQTCETGIDFKKTFTDRARNDVRDQADKHRARFPVPTTSLRLVIETIRKFDDDARAARKYLAEDAPTGQRMTRETFDSVYPALQGQIELGEAGQVADWSDDDFRAIENRDAVARLLDLLTPDEREVMARTYGLDGHPEVFYDKDKDKFIDASSRLIGTAVGMHPVAVRKIQRRCIAKLQIHAEDLR